MAIDFPILTEAHYREAQTLLESRGSTTKGLFPLELFAEGIPLEIAELKHISNQKYIAQLRNEIRDFETLKSGILNSNKYLGPEVLIAARIARGVSQKDLAERVGLLEQQIQRYERERYRQINASSWLSIARSLEVRLEASLIDTSESSESLDIPKQFLPDIANFLTSEDQRFLGRARKNWQKQSCQRIRCTCSA